MSPPPVDSTIETKIALGKSEQARKTEKLLRAEVGVERSFMSVC